MNRGRAILSSVLVALGALAYGASPIDIIPELLTGPLGLADDLAVWIGAGYAIWKLLSGSKAGPGTPPPSAAQPGAAQPGAEQPAAEQARWEQKAPE
ncbi:MAG: hypothetical protein RL499_1551 [Actinomycetota bacterium]|jgi:hypothetical protein